MPKFIAASHIMLALSLVGSTALAGPINPPPGPVAPTPGSEPRTPISDATTPGDATTLYRIITPGSYYLTGNITGVPNKHGIEITASDVTLDLNGFGVIGTGGVTPFDGVVSTGNITTRRVTVRNGTVRNWSRHGVHLQQAGSIFDVRSSDNLGDGITCTGSSCLVRECVAFDNAGTGINVGDGGVIAGCTSESNASGIKALRGVSITNCAVRSNIDIGISCGDNATLSGCTAIGCEISTGQFSVVRSCSVSFSPGSPAIAFSVGASSSLDLCTATGPTTGFLIQSGGVANNCTALRCGNVGFNTVDSVTLRNCTARGVSSSNPNQVGFTAEGPATLEGCTASGNLLHGFVFLNVVSRSASTMRGCIASNNGSSGVGAGVLVEQEGLRIRDCVFEGNDHGILANVSGGIAELAVESCTIRANNISGITANASTSVIDSTVSANLEGLVLTTSCTIRGCTVNSNTNSGIRVGSANLVQNNMVSSNAEALAGTAGILVTGDDNRIEGNTLVSNAQNGIRLDAAGNLVIRNTLSRTGATITAVAGNRLAQIISNPASGFISTDPNANFTY
ncbi:MAG: right-handed parallel beta-helix repeat-containing protein [Phycisphaerales bacterium]